MRPIGRIALPFLLCLMFSSSNAELFLPDPKFPFQIPFDACESLDEICLKYSVSASRIVIGSSTSYPGTAYLGPDTSLSAGLLEISPGSYFHTASGRLFSVDKIIISNPYPMLNRVGLSLASGIQKISSAELWWNTYLSGNNLEINEAVLHSSRELGRAVLGLDGTSHAKVVRNGNESLSSIVSLGGAASVGLLDATIGWGQIEHYPGSVTINDARGSFNIYSQLKDSTLSILSGDYSFFWEGRENSVLKLGAGHKEGQLRMYDSSQVVVEDLTFSEFSQISLMGTSRIKAPAVVIKDGGRFFNYSTSGQNSFEKVVLSYWSSYELRNGMGNELKNIDLGDGSRLSVLGSGTQLKIDGYNINPEQRVVTTTVVGPEATLLLNDVRVENKESNINLESYGSLIANDIFSRGAISVSTASGGMVQIVHGLVSQSTTSKGKVYFADNTGFIYIGSGDRKYQTMPSLIASEDAYSITVGSSSALARLDGSFDFDQRGSGRLIKVESGTANLHNSSFLIRLTEDPSAGRSSDGRMINKQPGASVIVLGGGTATVVNDTKRPLQPGSFVPILTAQGIQVHPPTANQLYHVKEVGNQIRTYWGDMVFRSVNGEDANHYFPELLRVGCASSLTLSGNCSVDVFGVRVAKTLASPAVDTYKLKFVSSPEGAMDILNSGQISALVQNSRNAYELPSGERIVSFMAVDGLMAVAEVNGYSTASDASDISIAIRGSLTLDNWGGNLSFRDPSNEIFKEYVNNLSSFMSTVIRANPGSTIRLTGHSLGGGLANFLGYVSGLESVGFNAPGIQYLVDYYESGGFGEEVAPIRKVTARPDGDYQHILNVRAAGDVVSLWSDRFGQLVTVNTLNSNLLLYLDASTRFNKLKAAYDYHRIAFVIDQISDIEASSIASIKHNGVVVYDNPGLSFSELLELGRRQVIEPALSSGAVKSVFAAVSPGLLYFVDPDPGFIFEFSFDEGSARFNRFFTPNISLADDAYEFSVLMGGEWVYIGAFSGASAVELPSGYDRVRLVSKIDLGEFFGEEDIFFAVTFGPGDKYEGAISSVPEVHVWVMWMFGLAFVLRRTAEARRCFRSRRTT